MSYCAFCGNEITNGANFCKACGNKVKGSDIERKPEVMEQEKTEPYQNNSDLQSAAFGCTIKSRYNFWFFLLWFLPLILLVYVLDEDKSFAWFLVSLIAFFSLRGLVIYLIIRRTPKEHMGKTMINFFLRVGIMFLVYFLLGFIFVFVAITMIYLAIPMLILLIPILIFKTQIGRFFRFAFCPDQNYTAFINDLKIPVVRVSEHEYSDPKGNKYVRM